MLMEPAKAIIEKAGGVETVAVITGRHISRVYRWMYPKERGGTGGSIPHAEALKLIAHAKAEGLSLTAADFLVASKPSPEPKADAA